MIYHLLENGFNILEYPELREVIQSNDFFEKASAAVKSPYIGEHCKSKLNLVEPVHHILRSESGHKIGLYSFVPITEVLAHYLMKPHYLMKFRPTGIWKETLIT